MATFCQCLARYDWTEQVQARADLVAQQIYENGVTYNVYGDEQGLNRPWRLGVIPNIIPYDEWRF